MKGKLAITAHWLCFHDKDKSDDSSIRRYHLKWEGVCEYKNGKVIKKSETSNPNLNSMFEDLISHFGGEIKDVNNEYHIEISSPAAFIVGGTFLANKKFLFYEPLSIKDLKELTIMLNDFLEDPYEQKRSAKMSI